MSDINELYNTLSERAHWTNNIIKKSSILGLGVLEETLTDIHLITLADLYSENIITKKFSRREEGSKSGADWLWIIGEPGSWLPLLIQAKIINPKTGNCQHFNYKNGEQRRKLLIYARNNHFVPAYCIYSYIPNDFIPPESIYEKGRNKEDWACSLISLKAARDLATQGIKHQYKILQYGIPWMDLFKKFSSTEPTGYKVANNIENLQRYLIMGNQMSLSAGASLSIMRQDKKRYSWVTMDSIQTVRKEIPRTICKMVKDTTFRLSDVSFNEISIISKTPINQIKELND
jgi:hypothetical protein